MEDVEKKQYNDSAVDATAAVALIAIVMVTAIFWLSHL
ncbi:hypothetical protein SIN8267_00348 [Sinobacterium norvegicum]|uniref:Uncharacterized protein n=1 Tax=Sinobacterium norvegicum TaxID=1641715 RepID=A0ABM9AAL8_9GAMM|nr:hypothetical protein SIN8267_00348 [Sinobacterium norvegicum]